MCGICGSLSLDGRPPDLAGVRAMAAALAHRGPDGDGFEEDGPVALGHRRLAILDLSPAGRQPMADASGRYRVTYNGEIYNYVELRSELRAAGATFRTGTDTEVLLEAFARWGPDAVPRLNGMFAFALWDRRERTLFAARDRFGEKPFFYRWTPGREFRFASEAKALLLPGDPPPRPRHDALLRFLEGRHQPDGEGTFFEGIRQLPPAHAATVRGGRLEVRPYWSLPEEPAPPPGVEQDQVRRVADLLEDSVRLRLRSDVPLGTCLSGGLDSSSIVALVARLRGGPGAGADAPRRATFTASFPGAPSDETPFAEAMVRAVDAEPHRVFPTPAGLAAELRSLVAAQDEPFSGPSIYAEWKVMELAREAGVVVLLNGQGGDEVFAGYHFLFGDLWWSMLARGRVAECRREMRAFDVVHGRGAARGILGPSVRGRAPAWARRLRGGRAGAPWVARDYRRAHGTRDPRRPSDLRSSLRHSQRLRMLPHLLRQADRSAMAFSREARLPLLDHRLVEYVDALDDPMKLRGGTTKWALREAVRGLVPEEVRTRHDKVGFGVPTARWLRGDLAPEVRETLASQRTRERGILDPAATGRLLDRLDAGDEAAAGPVWLAFLGETWLRVCVEGRGGAA